MASRMKKIAWNPSAVCSPLEIALSSSDMRSAHPCSAAQDALGSDDEDDDQQEQTADVLDVARDDHGRHLDEDPHDQTADQRSVRGAESTERDAGEHEQQEPEPHVPLDAVGQAQQDAAQ